MLDDPTFGLQLELARRRAAAGDDQEQRRRAGHGGAIHARDHPSERDLLRLCDRPDRTGHDRSEAAIRTWRPSIARSDPALTIKPWAKRELRLNGTYEETAVIRDQTATVTAITPQTEAALPNCSSAMPQGDASGHVSSDQFRHRAAADSTSSSSPAVSSPNRSPRHPVQDRYRRRRPIFLLAWVGISGFSDRPAAAVRYRPELRPAARRQHNWQSSSPSRLCLCL